MSTLTATVNYTSPIISRVADLVGKIVIRSGTQWQNSGSIAVDIMLYPTAAANAQTGEAIVVERFLIGANNANAQAADSFALAQAYVLTVANAANGGNVE